MAPHERLEFIQRVSSEVRTLALRLGWNRSDAEDVAQDLLLKVHAMENGWEPLEEMEQPQRIAYFKASLLNLRRDAARRAGRQPVLVQMNQEAGPWEPEDDLAQIPGQSAFGELVKNNPKIRVILDDIALEDAANPKSRWLIRRRWAREVAPTVAARWSYARKRPIFRWLVAAWAMAVESRKLMQGRPPVGALADQIVRRLPPRASRTIGTLRAAVIRHEMEWIASTDATDPWTVLALSLMEGDAGRSPDAVVRVAQWLCWQTHLPDLASQAAGFDLDAAWSEFGKHVEFTHEVEAAEFAFCALRQGREDLEPLLAKARVRATRLDRSQSHAPEWVCWYLLRKYKPHGQQLKSHEIGSRIVTWLDLDSTRLADVTRRVETFALEADLCEGELSRHPRGVWALKQMLAMEGGWPAERVKYLAIYGHLRERWPGAEADEEGLAEQIFFLARTRAGERPRVRGWIQSFERLLMEGSLELTTSGYRPDGSGGNG